MSQQCSPAPNIKRLSSSKQPPEKVAKLRSNLEQDIVLYRLACLTTNGTKAQSQGIRTEAAVEDDYEDVFGEWRLARFLRSVEGDVEDATKAVQAHLKWRLEADVDKTRKQVLGKPFRISSFPHAAHLASVGMDKPCVHAGLSRQGDLVHLETIGGTAASGEVKEMLKKATEAQLLEFYIGFFETRSKFLENLSAANGQVVRSVQIRDMSNFGLHLISERSAIATLQSIIKVGAENYPESTAYAIFTRAPGMFTSVWSIVSKVLPARSVKKVRFVSHADTPSTLMKYVQPESIVALQRLTWGEDGDQIADDVEKGTPRCFERTIQVSARSSDYVFVALTSNQKCSFRIFDTADSSDQTAFADVLYVSDDQNQEVDPDDVVVHTQTTMTKGSAACPDKVRNCLVVITLDNTSSWFSSRSFRVDVKVT